MKAAEALATYVGVKPACDALRVAEPRSIVVGGHRPGISSPARPQPVP